MTGARLKLAFSPCPNDTFIFHAWVQGRLPGAPPVETALADIDMLNTWALAGDPDVVKVSFHAFAHLRTQYALLHSGGALGRGCGPLIVARDAAIEDAESLTSARIAIPGSLTTAGLLLRLFAPGAVDVRVMPFDRIMPAVVAGDVDAGVIIHESRFTYPAYGLREVVDLGRWWEESTGHAIPLGAIAVRRALGREVAQAVERAVRGSLEAAWADPAASGDYVSRHAQEMDPVVCEQHIRLYVTEFSRDYGAEGEAAIRHLLKAAETVGAVPPAEGLGLFWDE